MLTLKGPYKSGRTLLRLRTVIFPVSSRRKIAEIRGQSNRPNPMAVLHNRTYLIECRCVTERDGMPCEGSKELPIGGRAIDMTLLSP